MRTGPSEPASPISDRQESEKSSGPSAAGQIRDERHCHERALVTKANYTTSRHFPYEDHADPVITTISHAWFGANFRAYIEILTKQKGPDADQPHRVTYRKLVRG